MKKTLIALGIVGVTTTGFLAMNGQAESNSPTASETIINKAQVLVAEQESAKTLNRLEGALVLAEALNIKPIEPIYHFKDVPNEHQGIINALVDSEIVGPVTDDFFGSEELLFRGETALWLNTAFQLPIAEQSYEFTDVNELCTQDIANVIESGIIEPAADATFGMGKTVTSEQLSFYIERAASLVKEEQ